MNNKNVIEEFCKKLNGQLAMLNNELRCMWNDIETVSSTDDLSSKILTSESVVKSITIIFNTWESLRPQIEEKARKLEETVIIE